MVRTPPPYRQSAIKNLLGELPLAPEFYWQFLQGGRAPLKSFDMQRIEKWLPEIYAQAEEATSRQGQIPASFTGRRVLIFTTLRYWIEHAVLLGLAFAGLGHQVSLLYLPYPKWQRRVSPFDARRLNAYARKVLAKVSPLLQSVSLLDISSPQPARSTDLPSSLMEAIQQVSLRDTQYTLQIEDVETDDIHTQSGRLFQLRQSRNLEAARAAQTWITSLPPARRPEVLLTPNGSILEMGAVYQVARHFEIPTVTYEFGEQRGRIWLAKDAEVMRQETDDLWGACKDQPLSDSQLERLRLLYDSRQNASLWENFGRLWQGLPRQGGEEMRRRLGLDSRPIVLLAANVIGDSLTLGRQVFSQNMTEWLQRTVRLFTQRDDAQLVIRIHPGERYTTGPSVGEVVEAALPETPPHIHLIETQDPVNTYDLVEIADLGLAYTTTVGMEMAMSGVPVIVVGETHYRGKGFTLDPNTWEEYHQLLDEAISSPARHSLTRQQVEVAWRYAYRFYFDYPCPFPWHLLDYWKELETWSMARVLSAEGQEAFGDTFRYLVGDPRPWRGLTS